MEEEIMRQNAKTAAKPLFDYNVPWSRIEKEKSNIINIRLKVMRVWISKLKNIVFVGI